jgi:hypothetical protein
VTTVRSILLQTIWPGNKPKVEDAFKSVLQSWSDYCENFESACQYRNLDPSFMVSDHIFPEMSFEERVKAEDKKNKWSRKNGNLLYGFVRQLNIMIDVVREELLPAYRQDEGYFLIHDDLGYRNNGEPIIVRPHNEA